MATERVEIVEKRTRVNREKGQAHEITVHKIITATTQLERQTQAQIEQHHQRALLSVKSAKVCRSIHCINHHTLNSTPLHPSIKSASMLLTRSDIQAVALVTPPRCNCKPITILALANNLYNLLKVCRIRLHDDHTSLV
jgi:hypothetical protein